MSTPPENPFDKFKVIKKFSLGGAMPEENGPRDASLRANLKDLAESVLPQIEALQADREETQSMIEGAVAIGHMLARGKLFDSMSRDEFQQASDNLRSIPLDEIEDKIRAAFQPSSMDAQTFEKAQEQRVQAVKDLSEDELVTLYKALIGAQPPAVRELIDISVGGKSPEELARTEHRTLTKAMADGLAQRPQDITGTFPAAEVAQAVHSVLQKATPEAIGTLASELLDRITPGLIVTTAMDGIDVAGDIGRTVLSENRIGVADVGGARKFMGDVRDILTGVEESFTAAGLVPDIDLAAVFRKAYGGAGNDSNPPAASGPLPPSPPAGPKRGPKHGF